MLSVWTRAPGQVHLAPFSSQGIQLALGPCPYNFWDQKQCISEFYYLPESSWYQLWCSSAAICVSLRPLSCILDTPFPHPHPYSLSPHWRSHRVFTWLSTWRVWRHQGHSAMSGDNVWSHLGVGGVCYRHLMGRDQGSCCTSAVHRTVPQRIIWPKVSIDLRLRNPENRTRDFCAPNPFLLKFLFSQYKSPWLKVSQAPNRRVCLICPFHSSLFLTFNL